MAPPATPFFSCSGFQHHIYKVALHEYWPMSSGKKPVSAPAIMLECKENKDTAVLKC
jgi:hypothetical protein